MICLPVPHMTSSLEDTLESALSGRLQGRPIYTPFIQCDMAAASPAVACMRRSYYCCWGKLLTTGALALPCLSPRWKALLLAVAPSGSSALKPLLCLSRHQPQLNICRNAISSASLHARQLPDYRPGHSKQQMNLSVWTNPSSCALHMRTRC